MVLNRLKELLDNRTEKTTVVWTLQDLSLKNSLSTYCHRREIVIIEEGGTSLEGIGRGDLSVPPLCIKHCKLIFVVLAMATTLVSLKKYSCAPLTVS